MIQNLKLFVFVTYSEKMFGYFSIFFQSPASRYSSFICN